MAGPQDHCESAIGSVDRPDELRLVGQPEVLGERLTLLLEEAAGCEKGTRITLCNNPHVAALPTDEPSELFDHAEILILATDVANELDWHTVCKGDVIDLRRDLVASRPTIASVK